MLTLLIVGGFSMYIYKKPLDGSIDGASKVSPNPVIADGASNSDQINPTLAGADPIQPQSAKAKKQSAIVKIFSDPPDAMIFIDGAFTGFKTPYQMVKVTSQEYRLKLVKQGYFPVEKTFNLNRPMTTLEYKLTPERYGYVNLNVINGGSKPIVEINGQIEDKKKDTYRVPAGVPITIRVTNEFFNLSASETITVNENQKKNVELVLKSNQ